MSAFSLGPRRRRLQYQARAVAPDELNQDVETWPVVATFWAEVRTPSGREAFVAQQQNAHLTHVIVTRYPGAPFDPKNRLVDVTEPGSPRVYNIVSSADPDGRRTDLVTYAVERVGETP